MTEPLFSQQDDTPVKLTNEEMLRFTSQTPASTSLSTNVSSQTSTATRSIRFVTKEGNAMINLFNSSVEMDRLPVYLISQMNLEVLLYGLPFYNFIDSQFSNIQN